MSATNVDTTVPSAVCSGSALSSPWFGRGTVPAAAVQFLGDGMVFGTWAALIPTFKARFGLDEGALGFVLLGIAAGAIVSMPLAGRAVSRHGSRPAIRWIAPSFCLALVLMVFSPNLATFAAAAVLFGALKGAFNVAVNSQAIAIENSIGRPIISTMHALWSLGGMAAAFAVGVALKSGVSPETLVLWIAGSFTLVLAVGSQRLRGGDASPVARGRGFGMPDGKVLRIGLIAFMALFAEGVMMDWSVVYTRTIAHAEAWLAPFAYGVFSGCMAAGRLGGSWFVGRFGAARVLTLGGALTAAGLAAIVGIHSWPATFVGLAMAGFGLSNLAPLLFGAGGRAHGGGAGSGVAMVSMMGYFGFLIGPPLIGGVGSWAGLPAAFSVVVAIGAFIAIRGSRFLGEIPTTARR